MGLSDLLKRWGLLNGGYGVGNSLELLERDMPNLQVAQRFVRFNPESWYFNPWHFLFGPPRSRLYSVEEIAQVLSGKEDISDEFAGLSAMLSARELIEQGYINFRFASRGSVVGVKVVPYMNGVGDAKYRFEVVCE